MTNRSNDKNQPANPKHGKTEKGEHESTENKVSLDRVLKELAKRDSARERAQLLPEFRTATRWVEGYMRNKFADLGTAEMEEVRATLEERLIERGLAYRGGNGKQSALRYVCRAVGRLAESLRNRRDKNVVWGRESDGFDFARVRLDKVDALVDEVATLLRKEAHHAIVGHPNRVDLPMQVDSFLAGAMGRRELRPAWGDGTGNSSTGRWRRHRGRQFVLRMLVKFVLRGRLGWSEVRLFCAAMGLSFSTVKAKA